MRRLTASHPDYERLNYLQTMLILIKNPHLFITFRMDAGEVERQAAIKIMEGEINEMINASAFREFFNE